MEHTTKRCCSSQLDGAVQGLARETPTAKPVAFIGILARHTHKFIFAIGSKALWRLQEEEEEPTNYSSMCNMVWRCAVEVCLLGFSSSDFHQDIVSRSQRCQSKITAWILLIECDRGRKLHSHDSLVALLGAMPCRDLSRYTRRTFPSRLHPLPAGWILPSGGG